jgi:hypothetical protein
MSDDPQDARKIPWGQVATAAVTLAGAFGITQQQGNKQDQECGEKIQAALRHHHEVSYHKDTRPLWQRVSAVEDEHDEDTEAIKERLVRCEAALEFHDH